MVLKGAKPDSVEGSVCVQVPKQDVGLELGKEKPRTFRIYLGKLK